MNDDLIALLLKRNDALCREAADEIKRLRARLEIDPAHLYDGIATRDETIRMQDQEIAALRAQVEALRRDAERYRWLRDPLAACRPAKMFDQWEMESGLPAELDASIDAARGETK